MDRRDDRESAPKNPLLMALQYSSASTDTIVADAMRDLEDLVADLANQVNATGYVVEQILNRPEKVGAESVSISREDREIVLFLFSQVRCRVKTLKERYYDAYNAGASRQPDKLVAAEPAPIAPVGGDRLLELINIYRPGLSPDVVDYCEEADSASYQALIEWTGPAPSRESALAALDLAILEGKEFGTSPLPEAMIRAAMLFIEGQSVRSGED
ncbi:MAG: hypothetical protein H2044_01555 [Rhizobiales bacterium]|nr:hypothetical protein [Hyphomicrobiales bacterium]